ncbi:cob--com heterodisulfide reductase subunit b [hydrocarbon metagenome]|uniref:Cob--com heterodisulfide reductase subunit b n=1 Tax=hydrocarbon metagenome TaxID=938273 RepID=A0A0W8E7D7_9ZZZZ
MMNVAYYPGCSLHGLAKEYGISVEVACKHLGINLKEIEDWNCCGATAAHSLNHELTISLSARNLAIARDMKMNKVLAPCAGCFSRLKGASYELRNNKALAAEVAEIIQTEPPVEPEVNNLLQFIMEEQGLDALRAKVVKPLKGLKLAAYYGCLLTRPKEVVQFDDSELPVSMDLILQALGADTVVWAHKAECCGGGYAASDTDIVLDLSGQVLDSAQRAGADAIVVACPMCGVNLDTRQEAIAAKKGIKYDLPVIYLTQLMGIAFGYSPAQLGLKRHLNSPFPLLQGKGLA